MKTDLKKLVESINKLSNEDLNELLIILKEDNEYSISKENFDNDEQTKERVRIGFNDNKIVDTYTVIFDTGDMYNMSSDAHMPKGVCMYAGDMGAEGEIAYVEEYIRDNEDIVGRPYSYDKCPEGVKIKIRNFLLNKYKNENSKEEKNIKAQMFAIAVADNNIDLFDEKYEEEGENFYSDFFDTFTVDTIEKIDPSIEFEELIAFYFVASSTPQLDDYKISFFQEYPVDLVKYIFRDREDISIYWVRESDMNDIKMKEKNLKRI